MNRGGFSWRRATGISGAKARLSRKIGIPLTKSGRQRKYGAAMGCATLLLGTLIALVLVGMALAHPGGLDKNGGHVDHKTGIWHYHGGGSKSSSASYAASTVAAPAVSPPTIGDLISQLNAAWLVGDLELALSLCDQIKTALVAEASATTAADNPSAVDAGVAVTSPVSVDVGSGVMATVTFPTGTAYITSDHSPGGNTHGLIKINIPGAMNLDNKLFKAGQAVFSATFSSSDPEIVTVSDTGLLTIKGPGDARILVTIGGGSAEIPIRVVQLPLQRLSSKSGVATDMGFPDATATRYGSELWYWVKYPDMCVDVSSYITTIHSSWDGKFEEVWPK